MPPMINTNVYDRFLARFVEFSTTTTGNSFCGSGCLGSTTGGAGPTVEVLCCFLFLGDIFPGAEMIGRAG